MIHGRSANGEFGGRNGTEYVGFDNRRNDRFTVVTAVIQNLGFVYDLRTGEIHVRVMSSLKSE